MSSSAKSSPLLVCIPFPSQRLALKTGNELLEAKLVASFHLAAVRSRYWWKGEVRNAREWVLSLRTTKARFAAISRTVKAKHPYELPEIIGLKIDACSVAYRRWITS